MSLAALGLVILAQVLTRAPELIEEVLADYPAEMVAAGVSAAVLLELDLGADGLVADARVVESGGASFDAAALSAARRFRFRPGEVDGAPAPVRIQYRTRFELTAVPAPPRAPSLGGHVRDRWTTAPLAGARVVAGARTTTTSTAGEYRLAEMSPGLTEITVSFADYGAMRTTEILVAGEETRADYLLERLVEGVDDEEVVRAPRVAKSVAQVVLATAEARQVPGTQGDTVKVVQTLPGVARPPVGSGALSVWGAAPDETKVLLDGVEIPSLYHLGGLRSLLASELVERVALTPAGQGAAFGRGVGGVVEVETRRLDHPGLGAVLAVDLLDAGAFVAARPSEDLRVAIAARQSLLHAIVPALTERDVGAVFPLPEYRDLALAVDLDLGAGEQLDLLALGALDEIARALADTDPSRARTETHGRDFGLVRGRWTRVDAESTTRVVPSVTWSRRARAVATGGVRASESVRELRLGLRGEHRYRQSEVATWVMGLDAQATLATVARTGSLTIPAREGDPAIFGRAPSDAINADDWSTTTVDVAPYVGAEITLGPLTLLPGLRLDFVGSEVSRLTPKIGLTPAIGGVRLEPRLGPRLAVGWALVPDVLALRAAVGLYNQPPEPEAASAVFGNPQVAVADGAHATVTLEATHATVHAELAGFVRDARGLVARTTLTTPLLAEALTGAGEGRAAGGQVLLRKDPPAGDGPFGWASYTLLRSERRASPESAWRRADFDRAHALTVVAAYALGAWSFGGRLRWTSGAPVTEVVGRYYDARRDQVVPVLGPTNAATLPAFFQLDLRAERLFALPFGRLVASVELQNVTAHENVEALAYRADYRETAPITGLPFLGIVGVRLEL